MLMDVAISGDRNVIQKEVEEILKCTAITYLLKYKELKTESQRMWNLKTKVVPVVIGATGTISRSLRQYLSNIPGKHEISNYRKQSRWALHTCCGKY
jgi:GTPase